MRPVRSFFTVKALLVLGVSLTLLPRGQAAEEIRVKHILVASQDEAAKIRAEIVQNGGDQKAFTAACRKYSKDPTTKRLGGNLGWMGQGSGYDPAFKNAAFGLKDGEVSQPVQSQYGWHLIYLMERRDRGGPTPTVASPPPTPPATPQNDLAPDIKVETPPAEPKVAVTTTPEPVDRSRRPKKRVTVILESGKRGTQPEIFQPTQAMEVNIFVKNAGEEAMTVFPPSLFALGLKLTPLGEMRSLTPDFSSVPEPENLLVQLEPYAIVGREVSLNDYYTIPEGRYTVAWDKTAFFQQLEKRFPQVTTLPDYSTVKADLQSPGALSRDRIVRAYTHRAATTDGLDMSVFERILSTGKYFAELRIRGEKEPVVIELNASQQFLGVRHFAQLALSGFYDNLDFYDVRPGDYLLGGSPTSTGTGAPDMRLPQVRNDRQLKHVRGTVSFVSRRIRKGPVSGGEIGSIFFILLKDHPEWDDEHVPFGKVVSGMDILDKATGRLRFESITIVTEEERTQVATPQEREVPSSTTGNPEAVIKTAKGNLVVELYDREARNTVANFIELAEKGFYNKDKAGDGKQTFFNLMKDDSGKRLLIQAGSPTNDVDGGPGYTIRSEPNTRQHVRGALSMVQKYVEADGQFVPDSAGSQFFICLDAIPFYDTLRLTVFGAVKEGLDVLDKLEDGDTIESIEITSKRSAPYRVTKIQ